ADGEGIMGTTFDYTDYGVPGIDLEEPESPDDDEEESDQEADEEPYPELDEEEPDPDDEESNPEDEEESEPEGQSLLRNLHGSRAAEEGFWQTTTPNRWRCCICDRPISGETVFEARPTAPRLQPQPWAYCRPCWDLHLALCGAPITPERMQALSSMRDKYR